MVKSVDEGQSEEELHAEFDEKNTRRWACRASLLAVAGQYPL